jgi:hypothetical protein
VTVAVTLSWPSDWDTAAQATLAAALITLLSGGGGLFLKSAFEKLRQETEHQLGIKAKIIESSYAYGCDFLMPLASSAGELATHITEYIDAPNADMREHHLDAAMYSLAQYIRIQNALTGVIPLPDGTRPLGLFLTSKQAEDLVWDTIMPPWVFNVRTLSDQSELVWALYCHQPDRVDHPVHLNPPHRFVELLNSSPTLSTIRSRFRDVLDNSPYLTEMCATLYSLCALVNYEVRVVLKAWYHDDAEAQLEGLATVRQFSNETKAALGLFYEPSAKTPL